MGEDIENATWEHSTYSDSCRMAVVYTDYVEPVLMQVRKHKKKRINKKWLKRYGMHHINLAKDIKRLAEKQRILKECRHEYHTLLNKLGVWRADK